MLPLDQSASRTDSSGSKKYTTTPEIRWRPRVTKTMPHVPAIVVLGAGAGSRYRGPRHKLSEPIGDTPILALTLRNAIASGMPVAVVVTPSLLEAIPSLSSLIPAQDLVVLDDARHTTLGMGDSIAAGVAACAGASGWLILPGDMPLVRPSTLTAVAAALDQQPIAFAQHKGRRGHPVGFGAEMFSELVHLRGDEGARRLLARYPTAAVELDDPGVLFDIDTAEDLEILRRHVERGNAPSPELR
jgi:molybdenum cofactor cytidylyltransferase